MVENKIISVFFEWISEIEIINTSCLDLGCGVGNYSMIFARKGYDVTAVDINQESLFYLKKHDRTNSIKIICGDITERVVQKNVTYDIVIASDVLEHLLRPEKSLKIINDVLTDNGYVFITIPNGYGPWEMWNRLKNRPWLKIVLYFPFYFPVYLKRLIYRSSNSRPAIPLTSSKQKSCTLNEESPHTQFWTFGKFVNLVEKSGFELLKVANSNIWYGWLPYYDKIKSKKLDKLDIRIADYVARFMASGWIFLFQKCVSK